MRLTSLAAAAAMAALAAAEARPYILAAVPGLSLMRRDTPGYTPETTKCGAGNTCAEACGAGFDQCPSTDGVSHCFNPQAKQSCCQDGSGNSCDEGYYCTHDTKQNTVCCPDGMDLAACAAAYSVSGGLETATPTPTPTPTPAPSSTSTPEHTSTPEPSTTETEAPVSLAVVTQILNSTTTVCPSSSGHSTAWTGYNSTVSIPVIPLPTGSRTGPAVVPTGTNAAAATSFSALLLVAAGVVALL